MSTTETTVQLLNRRDAITSRIATYRQPGQPIRPEDREELEAVMAEIHRREVVEQVAAFDADPHGWTEDDLADDVDPALYGLPLDSEIGPPAPVCPVHGGTACAVAHAICTCGKILVEKDFEAGACWECGMPTAEEDRPYQEGEAVEVLFPNGWRSGTFTGYRAAGPDEDFLRINVKLAEPGRSAEGCHPDCVRRPFPPAGWAVAETSVPPLPVNTEHFYGSCPTWRVKLVTMWTGNLLTGEQTFKGRETRIERCNIPLFDGAQICRSCARGWEVAGNRYATPTEIEHAEKSEREARP